MSNEDSDLVHIGIDFGTSNSVVYVCKNNRYEHVPFQNEFQMPSVVVQDGSKLVAGSLPTKYDCSIFKSVKRLLGCNFEELGVTETVSTFGCEIVEGPDHLCWYKTEERSYSCDEIAVEIFKKLKMEVDKFVGEKIGRTVVSVPARYSAKQRHHIKKAAEAAGFKVTNLVNEPTAASVCVSKDTAVNGNILVFDLGAGTTDVTILRLDDTVYKVLSSCGDDRLGGNEFDSVLLQYVKDEYKEKYGRDIFDGMVEKKKIRLMNKLMKKITELKHFLSSHSSNNLDLYDITGDEYVIPITRATFERISRHQIMRLSELIKTALDNSEPKLTKKDIDCVVLVGGGCFMPCIKQLLHDEFPKVETIDVPKKLVLVAEGCCTCARKKYKPDFNVLDNLSHSIGLLLGDGSLYILFKQGTPLPTEVLNLTLYADRPGITSFTTNIVEIMDEEKIEERKPAERNTYTILADVESFEFIPDFQSYKEFTFRFRLDENGLFSMEAYAMPEYVKCVTKSIEGIPV